MDKTTLTMRKTLGILGMILAPLQVICGAVTHSPMLSISATHYNPQYLLFEGLVVAVGIFLIVYRGYDIGDSIACKIAGIGGVLLCYFPTAGGDWNFLAIPGKVTNIVHLVTALAFFISLAYLIFFRFTKSNSSRKNIVYRIMAILMLASIFLGGAIDLIIKLVAPARYAKIFVGPLFIGEGLGLIFFGLAWLIKGHSLDPLILRGDYHTLIQYAYNAGLEDKFNFLWEHKKAKKADFNKLQKLLFAEAKKNNW